MGRAVLTPATSGIEAFKPISRNVKIKGFIVRNFSTGAQHGAIDLRSSGAYGWVIKNNKVHHNSGVGICADSTTRIIGNYVHHNGRLGLCGSGNDILIKRNEIAYNNTNGHDQYWDAGGTKFVYTQGLVLRKNYSHHNNGPGLWTDLNNVDTLYDRNRLIANARAGIFHEASCAAVIRGNVARKNGRGVRYWMDGAGIQIASSPDVEIRNNYLRNNNHGILLLSEPRPDVARDFCAHYQTLNARVRRNNVVMGDRVRGEGAPDHATQITGMTRGALGETNHFDRNKYKFEPIKGRRFILDEVLLRFSEWQQAGKDKHGKVVRLKSR